MATRKNWKEKGRCVGVKLLNPHSNCAVFSLYEFSVFCTVLIPAARINKTVKADRVIDMGFIFCCFLLIGN
jgi:hypothetical protein